MLDINIFRQISFCSKLLSIQPLGDMILQKSRQGVSKLGSLSNFGRMTVFVNFIKKETIY
jgi:hypothetical protein